MIYLVNLSEKEFLENAGDRIPLGLLSIGSNLQRHGYKVKLFDLNHTSEEEFLFNFHRDKPEAVGISVYTSMQYNDAIRLSRKLKGTHLIAGGHHATALPGSLYMFHSIVKGEGISILL